MLGIFRRKKSLSRDMERLLQAPDFEFVSFCEQLFSDMDHPTRAHVLVAYKNVESNILAVSGALNQLGEKSSIEDLIGERAEKAIKEYAAAAEQAAGDEVNSRRYTWFLWAYLLYRLKQMARSNTDLRESAARIWCRIAEDAPLLANLLPHNVVWTNEEKAWFDFNLLKNDDHFIVFAVNEVMPHTLRHTDAVKKLADDFGYIYTESTLGPLVPK